MEHIKEHSTINVPSAYKFNCEEIILKHFQVVSIEKSDMGAGRMNLSTESSLKSQIPTDHFLTNLYQTDCPKSDSLYKSQVFSQ
jgi:hypothetical protein